MPNIRRLAHALSLLALLGPVLPSTAASGYQYVASFYENSPFDPSGPGWQLHVSANDCSSFVQSLGGAYDDAASRLAFGIFGSACAIVLYDGPGGTGAFRICTVGSCEDLNSQLFDDMVSSFRVIPLDASGPCAANVIPRTRCKVDIWGVPP